MNIIFLDLDGVLNSDRSTIAAMHKPKLAADCSIADRTKHEIDPVAVNLINRLCDEHNAKIVLSTFHRTLFTVENRSGYVYCPVSFHIDMDKLKDYMAHLGIVREHILDATPILDTDIRGKEIDAWLRANNFNPELDNYAIIDDFEKMLPEQQKFFVKTNQSDGFLIKHYFDVCEILRGGCI